VLSITGSQNFHSLLIYNVYFNAVGNQHASANVCPTLNPGQTKAPLFVNSFAGYFYYTAAYFPFIGEIHVNKSQFV